MECAQICRRTLWLKAKDVAAARRIAVALFAMDLNYAVYTGSNEPIVVIETSEPGEVVLMLVNATGIGVFARIGWSGP